MNASVSPSSLSVTNPGSPQGKVAISLRNVTKSFDTVRVLNSVSLDIADGEFFSLLGASGCGKTTLLRIIGGFEQPTGGEVLINGRDVLKDPPYRRRTNMIFQHLALFPHLTVAENIAFGLEMKKVSRAAIRDKVKNALDLVRLPDFGQRRIDMLSGGQKQRVAMARALVNEPDVLLLDEPLGALDMRLRLQMQDELRRLHRATRKTFIFVTHDQGEAMTMSDRIAVMSGGNIVQVGTPREVYEKPQQQFVAQFLGNSNWLVGKISTVNADQSGTITVNEKTIPARIPAGLKPGTEVAYILRYEKTDVVPDSSAALPNDLEGTIAAEIFMGSTVRYEVAVAGGLTMISDMPNSGKLSGIAPGSRVRVRWPLDAAIVLAD